MKNVFLGALLIVITGLLPLSAQSQQPAPAVALSSATTAQPAVNALASAPGTVSRGMQAREATASAGKFLFVFFHEPAASQTSNVQARFEAIMAKETASAAWIIIDRKDPAEQDFVSKYQIQQAPMPIILAIAPNGAVTGGFVGEKLSEAAIREAFVTKGMQSCLAPLQNGKLVLLCLQNAKTSANDEANAGAKEFAADPQFNGNVDIIAIDPADPSETAFLEKMRLEGNASEAQTILMAPPAVIIGLFKGAVTKADLMGALQAATSGGCGSGGCSSGGCAPSGCGM